MAEGKCIKCFTLNEKLEKLPRGRFSVSIFLQKEQPVAAAIYLVGEAISLASCRANLQTSKPIFFQITVLEWHTQLLSELFSFKVLFWGCLQCSPTAPSRLQQMGGPICCNGLGAVGEHWTQPQKSTLKGKSSDRSCVSNLIAWGQISFK